MPRMKRCIVTDCLNTEKARFEIRRTRCNDHKQLRRICGCSVFKLHKFPAAIQQRKVWVKAVNRENVTLNNSRKNVYLVCSIHFPDGQPTKQNPYPLINMGYDCPDLETLLRSTQDGEDCLSNEESQDDEELCNSVGAVDNLEDAAASQDSATEMEISFTNVTETDSSSAFKDLVIDPLPLRRERRNVKKTYKALKFEEEKLANKIKFGRSKEKPNLVFDKRHSDKSSKIKDVSVQLQRIGENQSDFLPSRITSYEDMIKKEIESDASDGWIQEHDTNLNDSDLEVVGEKVATSEKLNSRDTYITHSVPQWARKRTHPILPLKRKGVIKVKTIQKKSLRKPDRKKSAQPICRTVPKKLQASKNPVHVSCYADIDEEPSEEGTYFDSIYEGYVSYSDYVLDSEYERRLSISDGSDFLEDDDDSFSVYSDLENYSPTDSDGELSAGKYKSNKKPLTTAKVSGAANILSTVCKPKPAIKRTVSFSKQDGMKNIGKKHKYSSPPESDFEELDMDYDENNSYSDQPVFSDCEDQFSDLEDYPLPTQTSSTHQGKRVADKLPESRIQKNTTAPQIPMAAEKTESNQSPQKSVPTIVKPCIQKSKLICLYSKDHENLIKNTRLSEGFLGSEVECDDDDDMVDGVCVDNEQDAQAKLRSVTKTTDSKGHEKIQTFSTVWRKLKTYYDYTEEEEITMSSPNYPELEGYVVYEEGAEPPSVKQNLCFSDTLTDEKCQLYTGFSLIIFKGLLGILKDHAPKYGPTFELSTNDQILLVIMKLKLGLINADLAKKFNTSPAICGKVFSSWIAIMADTLRHLVVWQPREFVLEMMPKEFKDQVPLTTCLIDMGQICIQPPGKQKQAFSKEVQDTRRFLFAVAPDGFVMFMSEPFLGDVSEKQIFGECSIKNKLQTGDLVLMKKELADTVELPSDIMMDVLPHEKPDSKGQPLALESAKVVERLKSYRILRGVITIPVANASSVLHTCAALCNLGFSH